MSFCTDNNLIWKPQKEIHIGTDKREIKWRVTLLGLPEEKFEQYPFGHAELQSFLNTAL